MKINGWTFLRWHWHRKWREGKTWLDTAGGDHLLMHHGFYSIEWARGKHVEYFRALPTLS